MGSKRKSIAVTMGLFAAAVIGLAFTSSPFKGDHDAPNLETVAPENEMASDRRPIPVIKPDGTIVPTTGSTQVLSEPPPQAPSNSPLPTVWPPQGVAPTIGVNAMLAAAMADNLELILSTKSTIDAIPKPIGGDRNIAREKEKAALNALKEGAYDMAIVHFSEAIKADPSDAELRTNLGYALMSSGRFDDAKNALLDSITLNPGGGAAWVTLGLLLAKQGDLDSAAAAFIDSLAVSTPAKNAMGYFKTLSESEEESVVKMAAAKALNSPAIKGAKANAR